MKNRNPEFDKIDLEIIDAIEKTPQYYINEIAQKVRHDNSATNRRINKMQDAGIIEKGPFMINPDKLRHDKLYCIKAATNKDADLPDKVFNRLKKLRNIQSILEFAETPNTTGKLFMITALLSKTVDYNRWVQINLLETGLFSWAEIHPVKGVHKQNLTIFFDLGERE